MGTGRAVKEQAHALAIRQGGVVDRRQLTALGVTPAMTRVEVRAGRWCRVGTHTVGIAGFPFTPQARWRVALAHSSPEAALDGVTALEAAGLTRFTETTVHLSTGQGGRLARLDFVTGHYLRSRKDSDVVEDEFRHVRPAVAAVRAGVWAASDRACATVLAMAVQQGIVAPLGLQIAAQDAPGNARKALIRTLANDLATGVEALSEVEFAQLCRRYRLPEPSRQRRMRGHRGRAAYVDVRWDAYGVVVEIDGSHHFSAGSQVEELLRHNEIAMTGDVVLRIPLVGLRVSPELFMAQVAAALRRRGWQSQMS